MPTQNTSKMKSTMKTFITTGYNKAGKKVLPEIVIKNIDLTTEQRLDSYQAIQMFHTTPLTFKTEII